MRRRWAVLVLAVGLLASLTTGCRLPRSGEHTVVTSFYPLYFIAERVAGRYNHVIDLTPPGVEPHEYELTVRQVAQVDLARVGFYEQGVAPSVDQAMTNDSPEHVLDVSDVVHLAGDDPHFWQDPTLMAEATRALTASILAESWQASILFAATIMSFSGNPAPKLASSSRITSKSRAGSRPLKSETSTRCTSTRVRSMCRRNCVPSPCPS